jgi:hypothetical protein
MEIELTTGIRVRTSHFTLVRQDFEIYRLVLNFISDSPDKNRLIKEYYVWLSERYVEDVLHIIGDVVQVDYEKVALGLAEQRFNKLKEVPPETGLDVSQERGIIPVADATNYIHPVEKD